MSRPSAVLLLMLVVLYKLGDAFALSLSSAFLIRGLGFSLIEIRGITMSEQIEIGAVKAALETKFHELTSEQRKDLEELLPAVPSNVDGGQIAAN